MARRPDRCPRSARLAAPSARRPPRLPPALRPSQPTMGSARSRMPPPPSAAVPGAPRLPASRAAAAALSAAPTPPAAPAPPHVALTPALLGPPAGDRQTPGSGRRDKRTRSRAGQSVWEGALINAAFGVWGDNHSRVFH
ncbi:proline-rich receptor-like protein kinase PERK2 [Ursus americanus]|uniref:proline-rich receptor-like protein kinase PERK2 n=1 Tax=Ursus americanus TaxID=9643 RepID=UPI001E67A74D|nr:proline-rich receptor-like protein kinase PERK2 [Ursus americanus]